MTKKFRQKLSYPVGQPYGNSETPDTTAVTVLEKDNSSDVLRASGTTVPTDAETGFAKGCIFIDTDVASGTTGMYQNVGTNTSCLFRAVEGVEGVITGVTAGDGLSGGGTEGTVTVTVNVDDVGIETNTDTLRLKDDGVTEAKVIDSAGVGGLFIKKVALAVYDFAVDGGVAGVITLADTSSLPDNAVITGITYDVLTTLTSATDASTVKLNVPTDGDISTAIAISDGTNPWDAGVYFGATITPLPLKTTAARALQIEVAGGEALTAGKIVFAVEYFVSQ